MKRSHVLVILGIFLLVFLFNINTYVSEQYNNYVFYIINFISILVSITILLGNKKMESKIAWSMLVLFIPLIGFLFYMILGVEYNRFKKFDKKLDLDENINKETIKEEMAIEKILEKLGDKKDIVHLLYNINNSPVTLNNNCKILTNGDQKFKILIEELKKAKQFIHLEYFIIKEGIILNQILDVLYQKISEGVEIKLLYDDFGCVDLSNKLLKKMNQKGIKTACFNKIDLKLFRPSINYRNHRKIVVIDNKVGFLGGINIGDEYAHLDKYYGFWRDTHMMIEGSAVRDLNVVFMKDWAHTTNELLTDKKYYYKHICKNENSAVQIIADGPDNEFGVIRNTFFKLINEANKRIWIVTPYLILDNELMSALKVASLSGIDVRIIVPGMHDKGKSLIYKATEAYFSELLRCGVKIYKYKKHFIHSKVIIIDDDIASIGTVNMDYRSFDLHFEITAILFFDKAIKSLVSDFKNDLKNSGEILWDNWKKRSFFRKTIESVVKIFSPLL
ncbi:MAG: cardiolipin synthase [Bacilli bacterium]|nr:cardiolipin synthase [Bacilli bacterium]